MVKAKDRLFSLDIMRGATVAGMILVNNPGSWSHIYTPLEHSEWNGCTPTDLVFPFFIFMIGVAITFALSTKKQTESAGSLMPKIFKRTALILLIALAIKLFSKFDFSTIRYLGVLTRIAIVYMVTSLIFIKTSWLTQFRIALGLLLVYWFIMTIIPVPGFGPANLDPETNIGAWLDRLLMSGHLWSQTVTWDPESVLGTIPAVATCLSGVMAGHLLRSKLEMKDKALWLFTIGAVSTVLGLVWGLGFPINKALWTGSYVFYTSGIAFMCLAFCYFIFDILKMRTGTAPLKAFGMNALAAYILADFFAILFDKIHIDSDVSLQGWLYQHLFTPWLFPKTASLFYALFFVGLIFIPIWMLYKKKIYIKV